MRENRTSGLTRGGASAPPTLPLFANDLKTQDAVIRNLEVIGEAARNLPDEIKAQASHIEWRKIIALRNMLLHEYFGISIPIVWDVIRNKLDELDKACAALIQHEQPTDPDIHA